MNLEMNSMVSCKLFFANFDQNLQYLYISWQMTFCFLKYQVEQEKKITVNRINTCQNSKAIEDSNFHLNLQSSAKVLVTFQSHLRKLRQARVQKAISLIYGFLIWIEDWTIKM